MYSRIVMDIDDVVSFHRERDYENAIPNWPVIRKMQELATKGIEFVLFTARGQISCDGDIAKIEETKGPTLRRWLEKHNVPYVELRFGKPIGDVYVDDGAMTPFEFVNGTFEEFKGGSNEYIDRLGKYVVKECKSVNASDVRDWFNTARENGYCVPYVYANTYNKMRMEYISGQIANTIPHGGRTNVINLIANIAISFASVPGEYEFDVPTYKEYIRTNIVDDASKEYVELACEAMDTIGEFIHPTFCHGDLTAMNVIVNGKGLYMIDPVPHQRFSSFMMDLAKLRMSVNGQSDLFYDSSLCMDNVRYLEDLDIMLYRLGWLDIVRMLEFTCWVRLIKYRYNNGDEYQILLKRLENLVEIGGFPW